MARQSREDDGHNERRTKPMNSRTDKNVLISEGSDGVDGARQRVNPTQGTSPSQQQQQQGVDAQTAAGRRLQDRREQQPPAQRRPTGRRISAALTDSSSSDLDARIALKIAKERAEMSEQGENSAASALSPPPAASSNNDNRESGTEEMTTTRDSSTSAAIARKSNSVSQLEQWVQQWETPSASQQPSQQQQLLPKNTPRRTSTPVVVAAASGGGVDDDDVAGFSDSCVRADQKIAQDYASSQRSSTNNSSSTATAARARRNTTGALNHQQQQELSPRRRTFASREHPRQPSDLDDAAARKIVQERQAAYRNECKDSATTSAIALDSTTTATMSESSTLQEASSPRPTSSRRPTAPGAVRVGGVNASMLSLPEDYDNFDDTNTIRFGSVGGMITSSNNSLPSVPFEPEVPIEAQLVSSDSKRKPPHSSSKILVSAHPLDLESLQPHSGHTTNTNLEDADLMDVVKNKKLTIKIAMIVGVLLAVALAVGLAVGFAYRGTQSSSSDSSGVNRTIEVEPPDVPTFPPMDGLDASTINIIQRNLTSPQAKANRWIMQDPYRKEHLLERRLTRFLLALIYFALDGENWHFNDHWLDYEAHECEWYTSHPGPICDVDGTFHTLNLSSNGCAGSLVNEMSSTLRVLDLSNNSMVGGSSELANDHVNLEVIDISDNLLEGRITAEIGWISVSLKEIRLAGNRLSGSVPWALGLIVPQLEVLDCSRNLFSGSVPDFYGADRSFLRTINFADNRMTGSLPTSLQSIMHLEEFNISRNADLVGTLPPGFGALPNLTVLDISHTSLTGKMPEELCQRWRGNKLEIHANCDIIDCCR